MLKLLAAGIMGVIVLYFAVHVANMVALRPTTFDIVFGAIGVIAVIIAIRFLLWLIEDVRQYYRERRRK